MIDVHESKRPAGPGRGASPVFDAPGALRGEAWLTVQTRQAQRLVTGRRAGAGKPAIIGLLGFATLIRPIWTAARADDAYADWWLVRVHEALEQAEQVLRQMNAELAIRLAGMPAIETTLATTLAPLRVPLRFSNPFPFRGAQLIALLDELARSVLTARHVGLIPSREAERLLASGGRQVRKAFTSPQGYRLLGITRADLLQGTAKALRAQTLMGDLPPDILSGARRAPHAPTRSVLPQATAAIPPAMPSLAD